MRRKKFLSAALVFSTAFMIYGQDALLFPKTAGDWVASNDGMAPAGKENCIVCSGKNNIELLSKNMADVVPSKSYVFSGQFKSDSGSAPFKCYFGLLPFNGAGQEIKTSQVNFIKGSETELAADCSQDDTVLKIKNGENWKPGPLACIAFEIDDSGKYSDLPNSKLSSSGILKVEKKEGYFEVTLKGRCGQKYQSGTKIRMHSAGPSAMYGGAAGKSLAADWTEIKGKLKPESVENLNLLVNLWPGVKKVKILLGFYPDNQGTDIAVMFKDIKLEELK